MSTTSTVPASTARATEAPAVVLGNIAIAWGLVQAGVEVVTSYPGTPSSEVLPGVRHYARTFGLPIATEWSINEKVAVELAIGACLAGKRVAVIMKQVGLNVAADPVMSLAYTGVPAGFVLVVADDPGPQSSQTEQDTRRFAAFAKIPVFDPASPAEAVEMLQAAYALSERHEIPVILRPTLRVCHAKQQIAVARPTWEPRTPRFTRDANRWAATPRNRFVLHGQLNRKLDAIAAELSPDQGRRTEGGQAARLPACNAEVPGEGERAVIAAGVSWAALQDALGALGLDPPRLKIGVAHPLDAAALDAFVARHAATLVLEETSSLIEEQITAGGRRDVRGRLDGSVPREGELTPEIVREIVAAFFADNTPVQPERADALPDAAATSPGTASCDNAERLALAQAIAALEIPPKKPTLCAGCGHRAMFWAIRRRFKAKGLYPSDIGCYTLGKNLEAVDTCYDMGASIPIAAGFATAFSAASGPGVRPRPIVATIGDSTFWHSGLTGLASAVWNDARFVLVILDNALTAMTGGQPVPHESATPEGSPRLSLERAVKGLGVTWVRVVDPLDELAADQALADAWAHATDPAGGVAVIVARRACVLRDGAVVAAWRSERGIEINEACDACGVCVVRFGCPALTIPEGAVHAVIDERLCVFCAACVPMCPRDAIVCGPPNGGPQSGGCS